MVCHLANHFFFKTICEKVGGPKGKKMKKVGVDHKPKKMGQKLVE
jgi:hypothetical protein